VLEVAVVHLACIEQAGCGVCGIEAVCVAVSIVVVALIGDNRAGGVGQMSDRAVPVVQDVLGDRTGVFCFDIRPVSVIVLLLR